MIGNGGHAAVLTEMLLAQNIEIVGFTAPKMEKNRFGLCYLGDDSIIFQYPPDDIMLVLGLGTVGVTSIRMNIFNQFYDKGYSFYSVVHESAIISRSVHMGNGVQIMPGVILQSFVYIGDNTIINTRSSIDHDCHIGSHCHISPGVTLSGGINIDDSVHVGAGATVIQNINIGSQSIIGAGSVVVKDIPKNSIVKGVPAK